MKKTDFLFIVAGIAIITFFALAPPETTVHVPHDNVHMEALKVADNEGKKAAEKLCNKCHNSDKIPLPEDHPPKYRCLFCHKTSKP